MRIVYNGRHRAPADQHEIDTCEWAFSPMPAEGHSWCGVLAPGFQGIYSCCAHAGHSGDHLLIFGSLEEPRIGMRWKPCAREMGTRVERSL